ncbi:MAG: HesA/MoeB/ThiF family protein [Bifidobacteriaceae bacterium]|nr:HesA/MoeB/ThiF family protein [Bifidobacteriaceae bacterium]
MQGTATDERHARQAALPGFSEAAQQRLARATVAVVGAGGLGCPALAYLAGAGVGRLRIIDPDAVDLTNLGRQVIYREDRIGQPKAAEAAAWVESLNSGVAARAEVARVARGNADRLLADADLVVDCSDNFATKYLVNDYCLSRGVPYVWAAVDAYEGRVGSIRSRQGPCLRCLFGPPESLTDLAQPGICAVASAYGPACGLAGSMQASEAIKLLTGLGRPLSGAVACMDLLNGRMDVIELRRDPDCQWCD